MLKRSRSISHASLWATAVVLAGLVLFQAGGHQLTPVQADMVTEGGGFTMLTMSGRHGALDSDMQSLIILDSATGWMLAYELTGSRPNRQIELLDGGSIARLFHRGQSPGSTVPRP